METASSRAKSIPRSKKIKYFQAMDEATFRDTIVRPLMLRLGYESGRDLCGPDEKGKDAIFIEQTKLGTQELVAVQTKKGNINMSQNASANLLNATAQLRTALETPVALIKDRKKLKPSKVILCASGSINDKARDHIVSELRDERIAFLDADELIELVDDKYPEVWFGIETDLIPYFSAIQAIIEGGVVREHPASGDPAQDLLQRAATDSRFVSLKMFRTYTKARKRPHGKIERVPEFEEIEIEELLSRSDKLVLILGEGGSGKSTAIRRLAYQYARAGVGEDSSYRVPIIMPSTDIARAGSSDIVATLEEYCCRVANTTRPCFTEDDLKDGRILLCVDGLDEVADHNDRLSVVSKVSQFHERYPGNTIIITTRMQSYVQEIEQLAAYTRYTVSPISLRQAAKIVSNVQVTNASRAKNAKELLRRLGDVHGIELSPLLVTVFAATSDYNRSDVPANITELFKKFTELMLGRWDESKGLSQQYQAPLKDFICQQVALKMHASEVTRLAYDELRRLVESLLSERGHQADAEALLSEIVVRSGIFRQVGNEVEFRHHLLQEFFAGRAISDITFVEKVIGAEWWTRPIVFYYGEHPADVESLTALAKNVLGRREALFASGTAIGLALQACYLSEVTKKIDLWEMVCLAMAISTTNVFAPERQTKYPLNKFVVHYLQGRDSVALANLRAELPRLRSWWEQMRLSSSDERDAVGFWLLVGLMEIGDFDGVQQVLGDYRPRDIRYLLALHMGAFLSVEVRALDSADKRKAESVVKELAPRIEPLRHEFLEEFRSELLEIRKGRLEEVGNELTNGFE